MESLPPPDLRPTARSMSSNSYVSVETPSRDQTEDRNDNSSQSSSSNRKTHAEIASIRADLGQVSGMRSDLNAIIIMLENQSEQIRLLSQRVSTLELGLVDSAVEHKVIYSTDADESPVRGRIRAPSSVSRPRADSVATERRDASEPQPERALSVSSQVTTDSLPEGYRKVFTAKFDVYATLIVGILDQIQNLSQTLYGLTSYSATVSDSYQRIYKICSAVTYKDTDNYFDAPGLKDNSVKIVIKKFFKPTKKHVIPITASSLLSIMHSRTMAPVAKALREFWSRMKLYPELLPLPFSDILRFTSDDIVVPCSFDLTVDPSMIREMPAKYDLDISALKFRRPTGIESEASMIAQGDIKIYVTRRIEGQTRSQALDGIKKDTKKVLKVKFEPEPVSQVPTRPALTRIQERRLQLERERAIKSSLNA